MREVFGLAPGAEVTTEANPDSVTPEGLQRLADGGFTRVSVGMQSAVPHVLRVLERTTAPRTSRALSRRPGRQDSRPASTSSTARRGSLEDWRLSLESAIALEPDHISAYALVVEEGTKLAAQVRRGQVPPPRTTTRRPSTSWPTRCSPRRLRLVRGEQLGALVGRALPSQRGLLG